MYDLMFKNCKIVNENIIVESDIAIKNNRIELIQNSINAESKKTIDLNRSKILIIYGDNYYLIIIIKLYCDSFD